MDRKKGGARVGKWLAAMSRLPRVATFSFLLASVSSGFRIEADATQDPPLNFDPASDVFAPPIFDRELDADTCTFSTVERRKLTWSECKSYAAHTSKTFVGQDSLAGLTGADLMMTSTLPAGCSLRLDGSVYFNPRTDAPSTGNTGYCKNTVVTQCLCRRLYRVTSTGCSSACTSHLEHSDLPHMLSGKKRIVRGSPTTANGVPFELTYGGEMLGNGVYRDGRAILLDGHSSAHSEWGELRLDDQGGGTGQVRLRIRTYDVDWAADGTCSSCSAAEAWGYVGFTRWSSGNANTNEGERAKIQLGVPTSTPQQWQRIYSETQDGSTGLIVVGMEDGKCL